jgi:hypothetical protein
MRVERLTRLELARPGLEGRVTGRFTSRTDFADFMLRLSTSDRYVRRPVAVPAVAGQPNLITFLRKQAIGKKEA